MKVVEVRFEDEAYEALRLEAEEKDKTIEEIVRERIEPKRPWKITPVDMGVPKVPVSEWREIANEGRAL